MALAMVWDCDLCTADGVLGGLRLCVVEGDDVVCGEVFDACCTEF